MGFGAAEVVTALLVVGDGVVVAGALEDSRGCEEDAVEEVGGTEVVAGREDVMEGTTVVVALVSGAVSVGGGVVTGVAMLSGTYMLPSAAGPPYVQPGPRGIYGCPSELCLPWLMFEMNSH